MAVTKEELRRMIREEVINVLKDLGLDVAKLGGAAGIGALLTYLVTNRDKLMELIKGSERMSREEVVRLIDEALERRLRAGAPATRTPAPSVTPVPKVEKVSPIESLLKRKYTIEREILPSLRDRWAKGEITKDEYEQLKAEYESELKKIDREIEAIIAAK